MLKKWLGLLASLLLTACQPLAVSENAPPRPQATPLPVSTAEDTNIKFVTDIRLFIVMAWLNWVGEAEDPFIYQEQEQLRTVLRHLPEEMRQKHHQAYLNFLPGASRQVRNGSLILNSLFYSYPPDILLHKVTQDYADPSRPLMTAEERQGLGQIIAMMPPAELMQEFYREAQMQTLWDQQYRQAHHQLTQQYVPAGRKILQETMQFLRLKPTYPMSIRFNLLGLYGLLGQTSYSFWENKFLLKINPSPGDEAKTLRTLRHEFSHVLLNEPVAKSRHLLQEPIHEIARQIKLDWYAADTPLNYVAEMVAECIEYYDIAQQDRKKVAQSLDNILMLHFFENLPAYKAGKQNFADSIPELFRTFSAQREIERWQMTAK